MRATGERSREETMSALERPHVLIVSDDADLSGFLAEGLVYAGLWTSVIAEAIQALEVFRLRSFDALLVDAGLGGIGARELVRRLRGRSDRAPATGRTDIPILVLAASPDEIAAADGAAAGADRVLLAPIELADLAAAIDEMVRAWRRAHPGRPWADDAALG